MPVIAAATAAASADKLRQIPNEFWIRIGLAMLIIVAVVIALRKLAKMNKVLLAVIVVLGVSFVGFNWIYERNEPPWASTAVGWLAGFFPSKGRLSNR
jgi:Flp pilus assembly protein protease CpaA